MLLAAFALAVGSNVNVKVDGRAFRVEVQGEEVRVAQKAAFAKVSLEARARMRAAVKVATGCSITDDYWNSTKLEGRLDCSTKVPPQP